MTGIKICGLQDATIVEQTVAAGADFLGFVLASSKRQVTLEKIRQITRSVPPKVKKIGVFVSPNVREVNEAIAIGGLDMVQLHGKISPKLITQIKVPVVQALNGQSLDLNEQLTSSPADYFLLDAPAKGQMYAGGNGRRFDWQLALTLKETLQTKNIFIAGGLTPANVSQAIEYFHPFAVDVSSGVETNGKKDLVKIQQFIEAVKKQTFQKEEFDV